MTYVIQFKKSTLLLSLRPGISHMRNETWRESKTLCNVISNLDERGHRPKLCSPMKRKINSCLHARYTGRKGALAPGDHLGPLSINRAEMILNYQPFLSYADVSWLIYSKRPEFMWKFVISCFSAALHSCSILCQ
jgi:hypothetical protein